MIERYLLRYFLAVVDQGNFSRAAAACNVSQPTLSVGIRKMEQMLGRSLFNRTNKRIELTEAGARLASHARRIESEFAIAEREILDIPISSTVRLGILTSIPRGWIEAFVTRLRAQGDPQAIELVEARERDLIDRLARNRIDLALTIIRPENSRFAADLLFTEGYSLALPAHHPLALRETIEAEELAGNPMIVRRHCELLSETSRFFTARGVRPTFPARTFSDDSALSYVRSGLGVTVMPDGFRSEGVTRPRLKDFLFERTIGLLYGARADPESLRGEPAIRTLAECMGDLHHPAMGSG